MAWVSMRGSKATIARPDGGRDNHFICHCWSETCLHNYMKENTLKLEDSWSMVKEKIKEANIDITDEDLVYTPGQEEELLDRLSPKMHMSREELKSWIESVSANKGIAS